MPSIPRNVCRLVPFAVDEFQRVDDRYFPHRPDVIADRQIGGGQILVFGNVLRDEDYIPLSIDADMVKVFGPPQVAARISRCES
jgi:hypothetical protein